MTVIPNVATSELPFAEKKYMEIDGHRMAYIDEGEGQTIVFVHGNPTSSYLWRNVMRKCQGLGRLIACDFLGFGDSDKLPVSMGPKRYSFTVQQKFMFELWDRLDLGDDIIFVLHNCGSMYGFNWIRQNNHRVKALVYMEALVMPLVCNDFPEPQRSILIETLKTPGKLEEWLYDGFFVEDFLLKEREFTETERAYYRKPLLIAGEERRPIIAMGFPIEGHPAHVVKIMEDYGSWFAQSAALPKLLVRADPGYVLRERLYEFARSWPNQKEVTVKGGHFVQESSPKEIGAAIVDFVKAL